MQSALLLSSELDYSDAERSFSTEIVVTILMLGVSEVVLDAEESDTDASGGVVLWEFTRFSLFCFFLFVDMSRLDPGFFVAFWIESFFPQ